MTKRTTHEPLVHLTKRGEVKGWQAWILRIVTFIISVVICAIVTTLITGAPMDLFFKYFFDGVFGTDNTVWSFIHEAAMLLLFALAVTPCFKMRFWNIGGEGQVLMGALGSAVIINAMAVGNPNPLTIFVSLVVAVGFGIAWAVIPAIFKAVWNTNETLLTLMMNYIAVCLVKYYILLVAPSQTGTLTFDKGIVGPIWNNEFVLNIIIVVVATCLMAVYLKCSKHGYELTVVGESENTAKYVGINNKKVIIRTLILCGALCGLAGFMLVSVTNHNLSEHTVGGKGFVGVLISWLGHFSPFAMAFSALSVAFIEKGSALVSVYNRLGESYPNVMTGIFFFFVIAAEFFLNYRVVFRHRHVKAAADGEVSPAEQTAEEVRQEDDATASGGDDKTATDAVKED